MTELHLGVAAPVAADALERALRPFGESTMLPADAYTSQAVLAWERRHLLAVRGCVWAERTSWRLTSDGR